MKYIASSNIALLDALSVISPLSSKNTLRSWVKEGRVQVDDTMAKNPSMVIAQGQQVVVGNRKRIIKPDIPVLYEDSDIVVIDKPKGFLSVASAFEKGDTVHAYLKVHYHPRRVFVVHRLDQDTSGAMVFALNQEANDRMKDLFEAHKIERAYSAIVEGELESDSGTWQSYQVEDSQYIVHDSEDKDNGRLAITHFRVERSSKKYSRLELRLETGRKNQIRVHCQSAGHPVAGDKKYGAKSNPIKRLCLHARLLAFQHPFTKKQLRFESPIPEEFYRLVPK